MPLRIQTSRKEYKCDECGEKISKGDRYWRKYEGDEDGCNEDRKEHINCELHRKNYIFQQGL